MEQRKTIVGIDVSKLTLDFFIRSINLHLRVSNNAEGFKRVQAALKGNKLRLEDCFFVMEYTGGYEYRLVQFCQSKAISYQRISGLAIKRSMGLVRGKSDKNDAFRIAEYGQEKQAKLQPEKAGLEAIVRLKKLLAQRDSFVRERKANENRLKELQFMMDLPNSDTILKRYKKLVAEIIKLMEATELEIQALIKSQETLQQNYDLLNSIKGIGPINAWTMIAYTENFTSFENARAFGAYIGVVPYPNESGTSIKGKSRTSKMANQHIKALLDNAAKSAIQYDEETNRYYNRRVKAGKHHMGIMNEVKFRLVRVMFAIVKKQEPYVDIYKKVA